MAPGTRFVRKMTDHETLLWVLEDDPVLRSSFANLTITDRPLDVERLRARLAGTVRSVRRLRQRAVRPSSLVPPWWEDDPAFDLDFHIRHVALPSPGTERQLLDLAVALTADAFDRSRPPWQFVVVDGLADGRGALVQRLHHAIADGQRGVHLSAHFLDLDRDALEPLAGDGMGDASSTSGDDQAGPTYAFADAVRGPIELGRQQIRFAGRVLAGTVGAVVDPRAIPARAADAVEAARSVLRHVAVTTPSCSPLWVDRSLRRRLEVLSLSLADVKATAARLGGTVNDVFVTGALGGARAYHRAQGVEVDELRMAMPISTRPGSGEGAGHDDSNAFTPTRVLLPAGAVDPIERFKAVQAAVAGARAERAVSISSSLAGLLTALPGPLLRTVARQQVGTVDFATSNVRGAPFELYVAGARIIANHPLGPMAGTAFNLTTLSTGDNLGMGLLVDVAAVEDPQLLRDCLVEAYAELLAIS